MKLILIIFWLTGLCGWSQVRVMTYNLRYANPDDAENYWELRKTEVAALITHYQPDIMGIQEGLLPQLSYLNEVLDQFSYVGVGREDGDQQGEYSAIFYRLDVFELVDTHTVWLSETPDIPSVGWDAALPRIVTYALLKHKESGVLYPVFNTHFDHLGSEARSHSAQLILQQVENRPEAGERVIVMGDLNSEPHSTPIATLKSVLNDSFEISKTKPYGPPGTYNDFNISQVPQRRIDYIFTRGFSVQSYRQIDDRRVNGLYVSDHLPVMVELE